MTEDPKDLARREAEFLLYAAPDGAVKVRRLEGKQEPKALGSGKGGEKQ